MSVTVSLAIIFTCYNVLMFYFFVNVAQTHSLLNDPHLQCCGYAKALVIML